MKLFTEYLIVSEMGFSSEEEYEEIGFLAILHILHFESVI